MFRAEKSPSSDCSALAETRCNLHRLFAGAGQPYAEFDKTQYYINANKDDPPDREVVNIFIRNNPLVVDCTFVDLVATLYCDFVCSILALLFRSSPVKYCINHSAVDGSYKYWLLISLLISAPAFLSLLLNLWQCGDSTAKKLQPYSLLCSSILLLSVVVPNMTLLIIKCLSSDSVLIF